MQTTDGIAALEAIDVHGHYGNMYRGTGPLLDLWSSGGPELVTQRARQANIRWTMVSPLLSLVPRGQKDGVEGNDEAERIVPATQGLLQWVVVNPLQPKTYEQAERMLGHPRCVGVKLHPEEHRYPIKERGRELFAFCAKHQAVVLTHSGEINSRPTDFVPFADDHPEVTLIVAHIGCSDDDDRTRQVRAVQTSRHGNIYADTSSQMSMMAGILEWAVKETGPEKVLFGTDTPLYSAAAHRWRINLAEISDDAKRMILRENAVRLFKQVR